MKEILEQILELLQQLAANSSPQEEGRPSYEDRYWTRKDVAAVLKVSDPNTAKAIIKKAKIPEYKHGHEYVIHPDDFRRAYESGIL